MMNGYKRAITTAIALGGLALSSGAVAFATGGAEIDSGSGPRTVGVEIDPATDPVEPPAPVAGTDIPAPTFPNAPSAPKTSATAKPTETTTSSAPTTSDTAQPGKKTTTAPSTAFTTKPEETTTKKSKPDLSEKDEPVNSGSDSGSSDTVTVDAPE